MAPIAIPTLAPDDRVCGDEEGEVIGLEIATAVNEMEV